MILVVCLYITLLETRSLRESRERNQRESRIKSNLSIEDMAKHLDALNLAYTILPELQNVYCKFTTTDGNVFILNAGQIVSFLTISTHKIKSTTYMVLGENIKTIILQRHFRF